MILECIVICISGSRDSIKEATSPTFSVRSLSFLFLTPVLYTAIHDRFYTEVYTPPQPDSVASTITLTKTEGKYSVVFVSHFVS